MASETTIRRRDPVQARGRPPHRCRSSAVIAVVVFILQCQVSFCQGSSCPVRVPAGAAAGGHRAQDGDAGYYLTISGNPDFYEEGRLYTVSLRGDANEFEEKHFSEFVLTVDNRPSDDDDGKRVAALIGGTRLTGSYQLLGDVLTRFSDHCTNTVTQTSTVPKTEIQVLWTAPPAGSGCVIFRASVMAQPEIWSIDSGRLSVQLCERQVEEHRGDAGLDDVNEPCCACEEAKYEVTFQGLWSKETHPKDFPQSKWLLHFSDIIGASHSADYRVWKYNGYASKGLAQVAKWGSPRILESELKAESDHIRTIIKARGLWYPNVNGKTFAVFRTDKNNHLVSLVSMLGPSPDWIVGVSGLELCQRNCTWLENKELFLYPWDAGVDSGISYESPDEPSFPEQPITRITSRHPNDPRQPFYNASGAPMKPLAKLTLSRQRLYKKSCGDDYQEDEFVFQDTEYDQQNSVFEDHSLPGCDVGPWSEWSSCSVTCGKGLSMRTRAFKDPLKSSMLGCDRQLIQKEMCSSPNNRQCEGNRFYEHAPHDFLPDDMCATTEWSRWSDCSTTCGKGFKSRTRRFFNRMGRKKCPHVETMEKAMCAGIAPACPEQDEASQADRQLDPHCAVTSWSEWSPCSVSCGKGLKVRTRLYKVSPQQQTNADCNVQLMEKAGCDGVRTECEFDAEDATLICGLKKEVGPCRGYFPRWFFDASSAQCQQFVYGGCRGNSNNFERYDDCMKLCEMRAQLDQQQQLFNVSYHQDQSPTMDTSPDQMSMKAKMMAQQDDASSDINKDEMMKLQKLAMMEKQTMMETARYNMASELRDEVAAEAREIALQRVFGPAVDCVATSWSPWSDCSATCGKAFRRKFRMVKRYPSEGGKSCPRKLEKKKKCRLPACPEDCILGEWGEWSPCSNSCGEDGSQMREREIIHVAREGGSSCGPRIERRFCMLPRC